VRRSRRGVVLLCCAVSLASCSAEQNGAGDAAGEVAGEVADQTTEASAAGTGSTTSSAPEAAGDTAASTSSTLGTAPTQGDSTEAARVELPRGGTELFPRYRLFGYSGAPDSTGLGRLGIGDLDERVVEMQERGEEYAGGREVMPVLELIATIVHAVPGQDGMYRTHQPDEVVQDYLEAARRHDGILLLNIQPGRADFLDEVKHWEDYLVEPDVGVALDPEWAVEEGQTPGRVYGRTTGDELDDVAAYLADLVAEHDLPEKVMVYHQVHKGVVRQESDLRPHESVVLIKSVDGIGGPGSKIETYDSVNETTPKGVVAGFKLFYEEDAVLGPIMTGDEVLAMRPVPQYILFE